MKPFRKDGCTVRMKPERIPARVIEGGIHGSRPRGRPRKTWVKAVKKDCDRRNVPFIQACSTTLDRNEWRRVMFGPLKRYLKSQRPLVLSQAKSVSTWPVPFCPIPTLANPSTLYHTSLNNSFMERYLVK